MATIRKRERKKGTVYAIQVKVFDVKTNSYKTVVKTVEPDPSLKPKQLERFLEDEAEKFEEETKKITTSSSGVISDYNITFREYSMKWLEKVEREFSHCYYYMASEALVNINQVIGKYKLREISPSILQQYFDHLDSMKRTRVYVTIQPNAREVLKKYNLGIRKIRREYDVQTTSLVQLYEGKTAGVKWATEFAKALNIPFNELFIKHEEVCDYKPETFHKYKKIIRTILSLAKKARLVDDNYASADYINYPTRKRNTFPAMQDDEIKAFNEALIKEKDITTKTAIMVFLMTGFRRGEVAGLEWKDVDFINNKITVNKSVLYTQGFGVYEKDPKTIKSTRTISVPQELLDQLKEYKKYQDDYITSLGDRYNNLGKIFSSEFGGLINPDRFDRWLTKFQAKNGLKHYTLHSLRHTNIALQIAAGVPIVTVSKRAGHARTSTTTDIYAYALESNDKEAADKLGDLFKNNDYKIEVEDKESVSINDDVSEYKKAKEEMNKLGFTDYNEYLDYLEFKKIQQSRRGA
jgi:integrase